MRCNTIRVQSTLRGLRLEEARQQVLRRQEATQGKVLLPAEDRLRSHSVRGCVPRRRRGRRGEVPAVPVPFQQVVPDRQEGCSDSDDVNGMEIFIFVIFFEFCDILT